MNSSRQTNGGRFLGERETRMKIRHRDLAHKWREMFQRRRRMRDPLLVFNMSICNFDDGWNRILSQFKIHEDGRDRRRLCQSSRERHLHRLGDSVMDHLHRNVDSGLAGNENDATPIRRFHLRQIVTRQAHATHKVCLDYLAPVSVADLFEWLRLVYAKVIDKNIDVRRSLDTF